MLRTCVSQTFFLSLKMFLCVLASPLTSLGVHVPQAGGSRVVSGQKTAHDSGVCGPAWALWLMSFTDLGETPFWASVYSSIKWGR